MPLRINGRLHWQASGQQEPTPPATERVTIDIGQVFGHKMVIHRHRGYDRKVWVRVGAARTFGLAFELGGKTLEMDECCVGKGRQPFTESALALSRNIIQARRRDFEALCSKLLLLYK